MVRLTVSVDPPSPHLTVNFFVNLFVVFLTLDNERMCSEKYFTQEKGDFLDDHL